MKAFLFDMDGVIFDTERAVVDAWKIVADKHGVEDIEEHCRECMGLTVVATKAKFLERYGEDAPYDELRAERKAIIKTWFDDGKIAIKSGVRELLTYLNENNIPVALASSTTEATVREELDATGLTHHFDAIICGDMVTNSKPAPDIFQLAASRLGVDIEQAVVIEDSYNGVRAGRAAGSYVIMVPDMAPVTDEMREIADAIMPSLDDVLKALKEGRL